MTHKLCGYVNMWDWLDIVKRGLILYFPYCVSQIVIANSLKMYDYCHVNL